MTTTRHLSIYFTRHSERILINHKSTRSLLKQFASLGLSEDESKHLKELIAVNAPFLGPLLEYLFRQGEVASKKLRCPCDWSEFIMALASSSPVCALIHPDDELQQVLTTIADGFSELDIYTLQFLQQNCPLLLNLLQKVKPPPLLMSTVFHELLKKANAPFLGVAAHIDSSCSQSEIHDDNNSYFPALPLVRFRGSYVADTVKTSKDCTKHGTNHPTLFPGIFTLFCSHGTDFIMFL